MKSCKSISPHFKNLKWTFLHLDLGEESKHSLTQRPWMWGVIVPLAACRRLDSHTLRTTHFTDVYLNCKSIVEARSCDACSLSSSSVICRHGTSILAHTSPHARSTATPCRSNNTCPAFCADTAEGGTRCQVAICRSGDFAHRANVSLTPNSSSPISNDYSWSIGHFSSGYVFNVKWQCYQNWLPVVEWFDKWYH